MKLSSQLIDSSVELSLSAKFRRSGGDVLQILFEYGGNVNFCVNVSSEYTRRSLNSGLSLSPAQIILFSPRLVEQFKDCNCLPLV